MYVGGKNTSRVNKTNLLASDSDSLGKGKKTGFTLQSLTCNFCNKGLIWCFKLRWWGGQEFFDPMCLEILDSKGTSKKCSKI